MFDVAVTKHPAKGIQLAEAIGVEEHDGEKAAQLVLAYVVALPVSGDIAFEVVAGEVQVAVVQV
ncbi:hypothetical protein D9M71_715370 [compost metagenome]